MSVSSLTLRSSMPVIITNYRQVLHTFENKLPRKIFRFKVRIALGYRLDDRGSRIRLPAGAGNFSLHHRVQNGSGAHPASYPMGNRGSLLGGKAVVA
jgi:hypothetical protein